jgi:hypothetical protein
MKTNVHDFKRLVLGFQTSTPAPAVQLAVEIAGLLHLDLFGLFLEDVSLRELASIPCAREIRPPRAAWHAIEPDRMARELNAAIRRTERMFDEATMHLPTMHEFKVVRGRTADVITSISASDDIIMVVEPVGGADRATQQFSWLSEGAFRSAAAVLLVPARVLRTKESVASIAASAAYRRSDVAAAVATATEEKPAVVEGRANAADAPRDREFKLHVVVLRRRAISYEEAWSVATSRRVPVLLL